LISKAVIKRSTVLAAAVALVVYACDPAAIRHNRLRKSVLEAQITERVCPTEEYGYPAVSVQKLRFGPYELTYPANFLQIDAHRSHKRGDIEIVNGERRPMRAARAWVQIHALAPKMLPNFMANIFTRRQEEKGDLYLVEIELFWSEDGSNKPQISSEFWSFSPATSPLTKISETIGLVAFDRSDSYSSNAIRFIPQKQQPNGIQEIVCSWLGERKGQGSCNALKKFRPDVWARYSFGSENIACWRQVDERASMLVHDFTSNWRLIGR
jgi:hypothetical protein